MTTHNLLADEWDEEFTRPGWTSREVNLAPRIGAELLGARMYELDPQQRLFPYHLHYANEEWLLVVRGAPHLRTPDGDVQLSEGDIAAFPRGPRGAHQVTNRTDGPVRIVMLSTTVRPDLVEYPDSGKIGASDINGERILMSRPGPPLDYWDGEDSLPPEDHRDG